MLKKSSKSTLISSISEQKRIHLEKKHDVFLLLQHLAQREEVTVKIILDCLYDVGTTNLIHNKVASPYLQGLFFAIAKTSKPVFRVIGVYWFKQNCPQLIADWLLDQVAFTPKITEVKKVVELPNQQLVAITEKNNQIQQLRTQVRLLTVTLITLVTVFGSSFAWLFYNLEFKPVTTLESINTSKTTVKK
jgi:hypothetical protein